MRFSIVQQMRKSRELAFQIFAAVKLPVHVPQAFVGDVGVNLGGKDVFVAQKFLDNAQVNALGQKIGRKTVAQDMRSGVDGQTGENNIFF